MVKDVRGSCLSICQSSQTGIGKHEMFTYGKGDFSLMLMSTIGWNNLNCFEMCIRDRFKYAP